MPGGLFHHLCCTRLAEALKCDSKELEACWSAIAGGEDVAPRSSWKAFLSQHLETMCETELFAESRADSGVLASIPKGSLLRVVDSPTEACCSKRQNITRHVTRSEWVTGRMESQKILFLNIA